MTGLNVLAEQKGVELQCASLESAKYRGDESLLRRMIANLIDNAIQYTPSGGKVGVSLKKADGLYEIAVSDTGRGIPPEMQAHIFERFVRAGNARSNNSSGAGLGLSIALSIARLHAGEITLTKSNLEGSTFTVTLPFPEQTGATIQARTEKLLN